MLDFVQPQVAGYRSCRGLELPEGAELCRTRNRMDGPRVE